MQTKAAEVCLLPLLGKGLHSPALRIQWLQSQKGSEAGEKREEKTFQIEGTETGGASGMKDSQCLNISPGSASRTGDHFSNALPYPTPIRWQRRQGTPSQLPGLLCNSELCSLLPAASQVGP